MRRVFGGSIAGARKTDGQDLRPANDKAQVIDEPSAKSVHHVRRINGKRISFADLAELAWPGKTEANIAWIAKVDRRTARRWLSEDSEPPAEILGAILCEIMRRYHQRE
jgi:hypothetical protein